MNIIPSSARIEFQNLQEQHKLLHTQEQKALDLTRAINQQLNQVSNQIRSLKTQKEEFETDAFLYTAVANKYDLAEKKFSERIAYLGNIGRKPLRLKDGRIKLMEYRGWNLFKRCIERPEYAKQADDLRSSCHLPEGAPTDAAAVRAHLTTQRERALQECNALTTKVEGLKLQWDQLSSQKKEVQSEHRKLLNASFPNWREDKRRLDQLNRKLAQLDSKLKVSPSYPIIDQSGPEHQKRFVAKIVWDGLELGQGEGRSKKEAETAAARDALARALWNRSKGGNGHTSDGDQSISE